MEQRSSLEPSYLLVTGMPRAGTSLTARLIDQLDDAVCLSEPARYYEWSRICRASAEFAARCLTDLHDIRRSLLEGEPVWDLREADGTVPTNYFDASGRPRRLVRARVTYTHGVGTTLLVAAKHNEPLTATLPELIRLPDVGIVAVVRHPLSTILSWMTCQIQLAQGRLSDGYTHWPEALAAQRESRSVAELHVRIYELYCQRYRAHASNITIVRYEDLVTSPSMLETITGRTLTGDACVDTRHDRVALRLARCDRAYADELKRMMTRHFQCAADLYPAFADW